MTIWGVASPIYNSLAHKGRQPDTGLVRLKAETVRECLCNQMRL